MIPCPLSLPSSSSVCRARNERKRTVNRATGNVITLPDSVQLNWTAKSHQSPKESLQLVSLPVVFGQGPVIEWDRRTGGRKRQIGIPAFLNFYCPFHYQPTSQQHLFTLVLLLLLLPFLPCHWISHSSSSSPPPVHLAMCAHWFPHTITHISKPI